MQNHAMTHVFKKPKSTRAPGFEKQALRYTVLLHVLPKDEIGGRTSIALSLPQEVLFLRSRHIWKWRQSSASGRPSGPPSSLKRIFLRVIHHVLLGLQRAFASVVVLRVRLWHHFFGRVLIR